MRIHTLTLITSFAVGIMLMLCIVPKPIVVFKFPNPTNGDNVYRDGDSCFMVKHSRVDCEKEGDRVVPQPLEKEQKKEEGWMFVSPFDAGDHAPVQTDATLDPKTQPS